ncbi:MAG TPA: energy transducer TonB [Longimicrobium sp.]|jgi:protein TonB
MRRSNLVLAAVALLAAAGNLQAQQSGAASQQATSPAAVVDTAGVDTAAVYDGDDVTTPPVLDNRDVVVRALLRNYPDALRNQGISGSATVQAVIDRRGRVEAARVTSATIPEFGQASVAVVRAMRFRPAMVNGVPVRVRVDMPVSFNLEGGRLP